MTEVPKIVYDRLRAGLPERALAGRNAPERTHPDADLLTGFAEQALSPTERDSVLDHLALCGDCREVIALALPVADHGVTVAADAVGAETCEAAPIPAEAKRGWLNSANFGWPRAWPSLRWAALAAGVALAAAVLLMRPGTLKHTTLTPENSRVTPTAPPASSQQITASPATQTFALAKTDVARAKPDLHSSDKHKGGTIVAPSLHTMTSRETAGTNAVAGAILPVPQALPAENTLLARNDALPIEKAKPALEAQTSEANDAPPTSTTVSSAAARSKSMVEMARQTLAQSNATTQPDVTWQIIGSTLQKSGNSGQNWEKVLQADHSLLCYASRDKDIWTGGQAGTLFHSADNGLTWVQVQPSINAQALSSDITHVDLYIDSEIVVSASNHEIWRSADGGNTWEKK